MTVAFTGAVLTGGASTRMGSDKCLIEIEGTALAQRVAAALIGAGAVEVVAVGGDRDALLALPDITRWVADANPGEGPLDGLLTALRTSGTDEVVVLACDTPRIDASVPRRLLHALRGAPDAGAAVAVVDDRQQPLTAAWRRSRCVDALDRAFASGERAPRRVFARLRIVTVTDLPGDAVADVDRPEDLDRYDGRDHAATRPRGPHESREAT